MTSYGYDDKGQHPPLQIQFLPFLKDSMLGFTNYDQLKLKKKKKHNKRTGSTYNLPTIFFSVL